jgi:uncharacterized protein YcbK (DUF882 family)
MRRPFAGRLAHAPACPCCSPDGPGRRDLLRACLGIGASLAAAPALAAPGGAPRRLSVLRVGTDDSFAGVYWHDGAFDKDALSKLDWVFRDLSRAEVTPMDPRLFDVLHAVAQRVDANEPFQVLSGYRAPETNASNALRSRRVSTVSLHMSGMAADCRIPGRDSFGVARTAAGMQLGGVGLYRRDGFVHLDCGPVRRW